MRGVVAAGHRLTAETGARVLREGGNAVDAAVAAVLMSFVTESPLTGPGAGGFMLVHTPAGDDVLLDFFVAAPGRGLSCPGPPRLTPVEVAFSDDARQVFHVGPGSCGVFGAPAGLGEALDRFGTVPLSALVEAPARAAREGVPATPIVAYVLEILDPILSSTAEGAAIHRPEGRPLRPGERLVLGELGDLLERLGAEGPDFLYRGEVAREVATWVCERGGTLTTEDLDAYEVIEREPVQTTYGGRAVLTNPPPASGGVLIVYALELLARIGRPRDLATLVRVMERTNRERTEEFARGLEAEGYLEQFMARDAIERAAADVSSRLGSTTHISVLDGEGTCASVTCSNGSGSGVLVPGTGLHLNNMLGESDLNQLGFGRHEPGRRVPSMMSPTIVLRDGAPEVVLGSAGSNRIRSAILQAILGVIDEGLGAADAVERPRVHFEDGVVEAEPGIDPEGLAALEREGWTVQRWTERNLYFGGVQAAGRGRDGGLCGGGDPRRGGDVVLVEEESEAVSEGGGPQAAPLP